MPQNKTMNWSSVVEKLLNFIRAYVWSPVPTWKEEMEREKRGTGENMKWHSQDSGFKPRYYWPPKTLVNYRYYWVYSSGPLGFDYEKTASPLDKAGLQFAKDVAKNDPEHQSSCPHPMCWYCRLEPPRVVYTVLGFKNESYLSARQVLLPMKLHP